MSVFFLSAPGLQHPNGTKSVNWVLGASFAASAVIWFVCTACCQGQEQYPKPLIHTQADHPAARIMLLCVDGLHAVDLTNWITGHPGSALAQLSKRGVTYTNAHATSPGPATGLVAIATGGTSISTGLVSDDGFDRLLAPPGSNCGKLGSPIELDEEMDSANGSGLDESNFPLDMAHGCVPMPPHALLRVNTMFEVVHAKVGRTAWTGENAAVADMLRGPSGKGVDDSCTNAPAAPGIDAVKTARNSDEARVVSMLHWIDGRDCTGKREFEVPALFGMSFVSVSLGQRTPGAGYLDAAGTPSAELLNSLAYVDESIGRMVKELKANKQFDSTWIVVTSPFGQSPMDRRRIRHIELGQLKAAANGVRPGIVAHASGGGIAMFWLSDASKTDAVVQAFAERSIALGIQDIYSGARLSLTFNSPLRDPRVPDILLQPDPGVLWGSSNDQALAGFGGMSDEDTHVALMVSGTPLTGRYDATWVPTTQIAPMLLRALGLEKFDLQALHLEHSPALPGIF